ncbi:MAG TPA: cell envelope integrity protein CreD [Chitinophagaceae bacterium]|nr:cell envelope integrity protein CreD [Chitinophagaceae bacterium]
MYHLIARCINKRSTILLACRLWLLTNMVFGAGCFFYILSIGKYHEVPAAIIVTIVATLGSLPVLLLLLICLPFIARLPLPARSRRTRLLLVALGGVLPYALVGAGIFAEDSSLFSYSFFTYSIGIAALLFACFLVAFRLSNQLLLQVFPALTPQHHLPSIHQTMETVQDPQQPYYAPSSEKLNGNKTLTKALITGALILLMLIPTVFVSSLVTERQQRQAEVVKEVTGKWASNQTIASPYLYLPYRTQVTGTDNKPVTVTKALLFLPENLSINGEITPEIRPRSIYKVLLYKSNLQSKGQFIIQLPQDIDSASLQWENARICFGITDVKGIEEKVVVNFNAGSYELSPGLPANQLDKTGLSVPVPLTAAALHQSIPFSMQLKIKGSEQLHFLPLAGNTRIDIKSSWNSPSFDGNNLPGERTVSPAGFTASWTINKANLPFGTVLRGDEFDKEAFAFGVSMLQPSDQYAKTMRSVKYAILFIGLTFSLFFIVELMQKKPLHPVQYVLVGLALVIFYTLLLSLSEFILFDQAYTIAATATVLLITLYAKSHFRLWKTASLFAGVLTCLYVFIFILIRLEDTALLVGSIGLFIVLALVMYGSRKINWYQPAPAAIPNL